MILNVIADSAWWQTIQNSSPPPSIEPAAIPPIDIHQWQHVSLFIDTPHAPAPTVKSSAATTVL